MGAFGENLRKLRESQKRHMKELAEYIGVSVPYISDIELGRRNPPQGEKLQKIAEFLNVELSELEVWSAQDKQLVEIDISDKGPVADVALGILRQQRTLTLEAAIAILQILQGGKSFGISKMGAA